MTTSLPHRRRLLCRSVSIASLVALSLMGCASVPGHGAKTQEALLQRATAYWQAMKDNDRVTAWGYEELSKSLTGLCRGISSVEASFMTR